MLAVIVTETMTPEQAFDQYHQAVFDFAYQLTRRTDLAEDIVQECFLAFVRTPERYDPARGTVKTFLFSIARNLTLKHYRDHRAEDPLEEDELPEPFDPRQSLDASAAVNAAVACLPSLQQEALVLFELGGSTLEEIAHIVGADVGTVKSRLHRARARLRRALAAYGRDFKYGPVGK
jgi:RNA polymerase sigma-70 factor (ECF subfamily)